MQVLCGAFGGNAEHRYTIGIISSASHHLGMKTKLCVYCGKEEGATRDHIPPRALFAVPRPHLVTVPCCESCRKGQSLDDEYFVRTLAMNAALSDHPDLPPVLAAVNRAIARPESAKFTQSLLNSMELTEVRSPAGIILGQLRTYNFETFRLDKVMERVARGLYWHKFGLIVPAHFSCRAYGLHGFADDSSDVRDFFKKAFSGKRESFGRDTFSYWVSIVRDESKHIDAGQAPSTLWGFSVFSKVLFAALIAPSEEVSKVEPPRVAK